MFLEGDASETSPRLVDTGRQRLVQCLDELPTPVRSLHHFERSHRRSKLEPGPMSPAELGRRGRVLGLVATHGCKFRCPYCPIPAYNQYTFRWKSPPRIVEEIAAVVEQTGIRFFFGTDDNFFNRRVAAEEIVAAMAGARVGRHRFRDAIFFGTEATELDVLKNADLLPLARDAGLRPVVRHRRHDCRTGQQRTESRENATDLRSVAAARHRPHAHDDPS